MAATQRGKQFLIFDTKWYLLDRSSMEVKTIQPRQIHANYSMWGSCYFREVVRLDEFNFASAQLQGIIIARFDLAVGRIQHKRLL